MLSLPHPFISVIGVFAPVFSQSVWPPVKVLLTGAVLAPRKRTMDVLPGMNAGVSIFATLSPIEGSRVAEEDVGRLGIEPSAAKAYPSPA
jgi:hypothetical protein